MLPCQLKFELHFRTICELERGNTHNIVNVFTEGEAAQELLDKLSGEVRKLRALSGIGVGALDWYFLPCLISKN